MGSIMNTLEERGAFFDVKREAVKTASGKQVPGKVAICRADDGSPLGIVSEKYNLVTTREIFEKFDKALDKSKVDTAGVELNIMYANRGARTMVRMKFPHHTIRVRDEDESILEIVTRQSYDGRWKFSTRGGAVRIACLNGMLLGDWAASYSEYHNANLNVDLAAQKLANILNAFDGTKAHWQKMLRAKVTDEKAWRVFCLFADRPHDFKRGLAAYKEATKANTATKMMDHWIKNEKIEIGDNAFSLYNTLTHHSTHAKLRKDKEAISMDLRENKVAAILSSKYWNERVVS